MNDHSIVPIGACCCILGAFVMGFIMDNVNRDYQALWADMVKAQEICEEFNSVPEEIDLSGEIVCANGGTADYNQFGK